MDDLDNENCCAMAVTGEHSEYCLIPTRDDLNKAANDLQSYIDYLKAELIFMQNFDQSDDTSEDT